MRGTVVLARTGTLRLFLGLILHERQVVALTAPWRIFDETVASCVDCLGLRRLGHSRCRSGEEAQHRFHPRRRRGLWRLRLLGPPLCEDAGPRQAGQAKHVLQEFLRRRRHLLPQPHFAHDRPFHRELSEVSGPARLFGRGHHHGNPAPPRLSHRPFRQMAHRDRACQRHLRHARHQGFRRRPQGPARPRCRHRRQRHRIHARQQGPAVLRQRLVPHAAQPGQSAAAVRRTLQGRQGQPARLQRPLHAGLSQAGEGVGREHRRGNEKATRRSIATRRAGGTLAQDAGRSGAEREHHRCLHQRQRAQCLWLCLDPARPQARSPRRRRAAAAPGALAGTGPRGARR